MTKRRGRFKVQRVVKLNARSVHGSPVGTVWETVVVTDSEAAAERVAQGLRTDQKDAVVRIRPERAAERRAVGLVSPFDVER
jgi:hypothetical protein